MDRPSFRNSPVFSTPPGLTASPAHTWTPGWCHLHREPDPAGARVRWGLAWEALPEVTVATLPGVHLWWIWESHDSPAY